MLFSLSDDNKKLFQYLRSRSAVNDDCQGEYKLDPAELVLNISEGCNLTCSYCFAGQGSYGREVRWMTEEQAYDYTIAAINRFPSLKLIKLFGGEPFMNPRAIKGVCRAVHENGDRKIDIATVTNMTIFSNLYVDLIEEYDIHITVSIDGPKEIHDRYRKFRNGKGSFDIIGNNIEKYREHGISIKNFESVYTFSEYLEGFSIGKVVDYLIESFQAEWVHVVPDSNTISRLNKTESLAFLNALYLDTSRLYCGSVSSSQSAKQSLMNEILDVVFNKNVNALWCSLGQRTITIAADGEVTPCYTLLSDDAQWKMADDVKQLNADSVPVSVIDSLLQASSSSHRECDGCILQGICRGCPGGEFSASHHFTNKSPVRCAFLMGALEGTLTGWRKRVGCR